MEEPEVAPYGGIMVQTLEEEKTREAKLKEQAIEVQVNNQRETVRPEALHIRGVDNLSTEDIKAFIDYYVNYRVEEYNEGTEKEKSEVKRKYEQLPVGEQLEFRIQWVNDSSVNIAFATMEDALKSLAKISILSEDYQEKSDDEEKIHDAIQEREAKPYNPTIDFRKQQNLKNRLQVGLADEKEEQREENAGMEEDETSIVLYVRMSFQSDRKVKNASAYSRYYLLHGEPERKPRPHPYRRRESLRKSRRDDEDEDLFADKLRQRERSPIANKGDEEEDLFADKLRARKHDREQGRHRDRSRSPMRID